MSERVSASFPSSCSGAIMPTTSPALAVVLGVAVLGTLVIGVYPRLLFEVAELSARTLGVAGVAAALR